MHKCQCVRCKRFFSVSELDLKTMEIFSIKPFCPECEKIILSGQDPTMY